MAFNVSFNNSVVSNAMVLSSARQASGDSQLTISQAIPSGTVDQEILAAIDISHAKLVAIKSTQNITIKTNSSGAPDDTLSIVANRPLVWQDGDYNALFLTADVAKIFVSNATLAEATLQIIALIDLP